MCTVNECGSAALERHMDTTCALECSCSKQIDIFGVTLTLSVLLSLDQSLVEWLPSMFPCCRALAVKPLLQPVLI